MTNDAADRLRETLIEDGWAPRSLAMNQLDEALAQAREQGAKQADALLRALVTTLGTQNVGDEPGSNDFWIAYDDARAYLARKDGASDELLAQQQADWEAEGGTIPPTLARKDGADAEGENDAGAGSTSSGWKPPAGSAPGEDGPGGEQVPGGNPAPFATLPDTGLDVDALAMAYHEHRVTKHFDSRVCSRGCFVDIVALVGILAEEREAP